MGLVKTFLQIAVTLSLAVFISTPSVAAITPAATCADYSIIEKKPVMLLQAVKCQKVQFIVNNVRKNFIVLP